MISMEGITSHPSRYRDGSRAGLYRLWVKRQRGHPEVRAPEWASAAVSDHPTSLHLPRAHSQPEVGWPQRINGTLPFWFRYAKVVTGPASAEKRAHCAGSGHIY